MAVKGDAKRGSLPLPMAVVAGEATFTGGIAVVDVPRAALLATLPSSVGLLPSHSSSCSCLLAFGEQSNGTAFLAGVPVPWGVRYHELMVAVPFVQRRGGGSACLFVLGMACDAWWAVWNGNAYYGFRKRLASMSWDGERFLVSDDGDRRSFDAALQPRAGSDRDELAWIQSAAALPVLGVSDSGIVVQSRFEWDFRDAAVEPASLSLAVGRHFRELPIGEGVTASERAFLVRGMRWRLSWPAPAASF